MSDKQKKGRSAEAWRDVPGYEGLYMVSDSGIVTRSTNFRGPAGALKARHDPNGYLTVDLYKDGNGKRVRVHRIVAAAFYGIHEGLTVNHKDGNKENNHVDNLEWLTLSDNHKHAYKTGLKVVTDKQREAARNTGRRTAALNRVKKPVIRHGNGVADRFETVRAGADSVAGCSSAIVKCCKHKKPQYKGYRWEYADQ